MAGRIRTIKPELREDLRFASLSERAALLFVMLHTLADDKGRLPGGIPFLKGAVFFARSATSASIGKALAELEAVDFVHRYEVNGAPFIEIADWSLQGSVTYQRIEKPQPARYPAPGSLRSGNDSGNDSRTHSGTDLRSPITELRISSPSSSELAPVGSDAPEEQTPAAAPHAAAVLHVEPDQIAQDDRAGDSAATRGGNPETIAQGLAGAFNAKPARFGPKPIEAPRKFTPQYPARATGPPPRSEVVPDVRATAELVVEYDEYDRHAVDPSDPEVRRQINSVLGRRT